MDALSGLKEQKTSINAHNAEGRCPNYIFSKPTALINLRGSGKNTKRLAQIGREEATDFILME